MPTDKQSIEDQIANIAAPLAASLGVHLWGIEVLFGGRSVVRVYAEGTPAPTAGVQSTSQEPQRGFEQNVANPLDALATGDTDTCEASESGFDESSTGKNIFEDAVAEGGITVEQCAELSRLLGLSLEVEDIIEDAYVLEVSSPGLDRRFFSCEQLVMAINKKIEVTVKFPLPDIPARRRFIGVLEEIVNDSFVVQVTEPDDTRVTILWDQVRKVRQVYSPPEKMLPGKGKKQPNKA